MSSVVACFVKTPGLSPVKTRLAAEIGATRAAEFYALAIESVRAVLREVAARGIAKPVWAVAERGGLTHPLWQDCGRVEQGEGPLGERLDRVYRHLVTQSDHVLLIGADSPQVSASRLSQAVDHLEQGAPFVLGRCPDGGFYLFGGSKPLPESVWWETPWSSPETADAFQARVAEHGVVAPLPPLCDVDIADDLPRLFEDLESLGELLPAQAALHGWLRNLKDGISGRD